MQSTDKMLQLLFKCALCNGLLVDATAILPCLHTHCRSCILQYAKCSNACPQCGSFFEARHEYLRRDYLLQRLIYRLYPQHFQNEVRSQLDFIRKQSANDNMHDFNISLNLTVRLETAVNNTITTNSQESDRLYLRCPLQMSIGTLKKFLYRRLQLDNLKYQISIDCEEYNSFNDEDTILECLLLIGRNVLDHQPLTLIVILSQYALQTKASTQNNATTLSRYPIRKRRAQTLFAIDKFSLTANSSSSSSTQTKETCSSESVYDRLPSSSTDSSSQLHSESMRSTFNDFTSSGELFENTTETPQSTRRSSSTRTSKYNNESDDLLKPNGEFNSPKNIRSSLATCSQLQSVNAPYKGRFLIKTTTEIQTADYESDLCKLDDVRESSPPKMPDKSFTFQQKQCYNHPSIINVQNLEMSLSFPKAL
ncbi:hypothetical protein GJ496_008522 [Pomphorhynchus laevis]|nr:hypothetical protein GJ496_008522 [Pomphorhynchus laevis]